MELKCLWNAQVRSPLAYRDLQPGEKSEAVWEGLRYGTSPTGREGELQLDPKLVPWAWASKSLYAWPWLVLVGHLPGPGVLSCTYILMINAALLPYSPSQ